MAPFPYAASPALNNVEIPAFLRQNPPGKSEDPEVQLGLLPPGKRSSSFPLYTVIDRETRRRRLNSPSSETVRTGRSKPKVASSPIQRQENPKAFGSSQSPRIEQQLGLAVIEEANNVQERTPIDDGQASLSPIIYASDDEELPPMPPAPRPKNLPSPDLEPWEGTPFPTLCTLEHSSKACSGCCSTLPLNYVSSQIKKRQMHSWHG